MIYNQKIALEVFCFQIFDLFFLFEKVIWLLSFNQLIILVSFLYKVLSFFVLFLLLSFNSSNFLFFLWSWDFSILKLSIYLILLSICKDFSFELNTLSLLIKCIYITYNFTFDRKIFKFFIVINWALLITDVIIFNFERFLRLIFHNYC